MIEFLNETIEKEKINLINLLPIHVDTGILFNHYSNFSDVLLESLEHYYQSKNKYCLGVESGYHYFFRTNSNHSPPVICNLDYKNFLFYSEFSNSETKRAITIGMNGDSSHLQLNFYSKFNTKDVKLMGKLTLISNMFNNGIGMHLLNIFYEFMEKDIFDEDELFKKLDFS